MRRGMIPDLTCDSFLINHSIFLNKLLTHNPHPAVAIPLCRNMFAFPIFRHIVMLGCGVTKPFVMAGTRGPDGALYCRWTHYSGKIRTLSGRALPFVLVLHCHTGIWELLISFIVWSFPQFSTKGLKTFLTFVVFCTFLTVVLFPCTRGRQADVWKRRQQNIMTSVTSFPSAYVWPHTEEVFNVDWGPSSR